VPVSKSGRPSNKNGRFTKRAKGASGRSRKKERGAKNAEAAATKEMAKMATEPHQTIDVDMQDVREEEVTSAVAQHLQAEREAKQDVIECEDTACEECEENYFLTAEVKQELGDFFARKEEVKRMCVVCLFVTVHNANRDEATWTGKNGTIDKIQKAMALPAKSQLDHILRDALEHRRRGDKCSGKRKRREESGCWQTSFHRLEVHRGTNHS
jgi:hypothetical protein